MLLRSIFSLYLLSSLSQVISRPVSVVTSGDPGSVQRRSPSIDAVLPRDPSHAVNVKATKSTETRQDAAWLIVDAQVLDEPESEKVRTDPAWLIVSPQELEKEEKRKDSAWLIVSPELEVPELP
ncbi:hypothetical protein CC1G_08818 [Coprinopsis cinerea okayama7|uniref:Uncharacterized protein n=1 Tax=Coprinopsis cinerea (strain Okayama-7 / 130 / ATCC MYA-4618 / FGSC 9003) TaxID=240176 RepID=A8N468_COPC7|nr:hypothetical protein CC1G_08818 [Coprinopsis cinerea okayama7\|eukprot:XP_001829663.1 hypothetical protein CC1G_08818 [Coprinopsis cinerea okayama7\